MDFLFIFRLLKTSILAKQHIWSLPLAFKHVKATVDKAMHLYAQKDIFTKGVRQYLQLCIWYKGKAMCLREGFSMISNQKRESSSGLGYKFSCKDCFLALSICTMGKYLLLFESWKEQLVACLCFTALLLECPTDFVAQRRKEWGMDLKISAIQMGCRLGLESGILNQVYNTLSVYLLSTSHRLCKVPKISLGGDKTFWGWQPTCILWVIQIQLLSGVIQIHISHLT